MAKPSEVVILAEDQLHLKLVRRYLYRLKFLPHQIIPLPLPNGRGCGEQWVRENYAKAVRAFRQRSSSASSALIVIIDADIRDTSKCLRALEDALDADEISVRKQHDRIVLLIPKRNAETWIKCLLGHDVNEEKDYKHRAEGGMTPQEFLDMAEIASKTLFAWSRPNGTPSLNCIPSLHAALPELRRLEIPTL